MGNNWETVCIDDLKSPEKYSCVGGPFGSSLSRKHYVDSGVPVIRGVNLSGDSFSESDFVFVSTEKALELQRNMAFRGDLVFTQRGTLGQVALIPDDSNYEQYVVSQSQMKLTINSEIADPYFLYSYFRTKEAKTLIEKSAIVGGVPHINLGILKEFKLKLPPLRVQKQVANISRLLDDKIHLNRQINQTLEQMAQALFKSWFVDFDPVVDNALDAGFFEQNSDLPEELLRRAEQRKAVRQRPDFKPLPAETRQLFPAAFEECEEPSLGLGGWVPKGWVKASIYEVMDIVFGAPFKSSLFNDSKDGMPIIRIRDLKTGKPQIYSTELHSKKTLIKTGDILVGMDAEFRATVWLGSKGFLNQRLFLAEPKNESISNMFIKCSLDPLLEKEEKSQVGTTVAHLGKKDIDKFHILLPSGCVLRMYKNISDNLLSDLIARVKVSNSLTNIRDTLLPKLISGELRLSDDGTLASSNTDC
nr:restriction endonuclease subunit S [Plesiomonas shigelloides]